MRDAFLDEKVFAAARLVGRNQFKLIPDNLWKIAAQWFRILVQNAPDRIKSCGTFTAPPRSRAVVHEFEFMRYNSVNAMNERRTWTFLSNHAHVLIALAKEPQLRVRDLSERVGITERAVAQILADLVDARVLKRHRAGRRNVYEIDPTVPLRHPVEAHRTVGDILHLADPAVKARGRHLSPVR